MYVYLFPYSTLILFVATVHAILVCNASSELTYIDNLKSTSVSSHTVPILRHLLDRYKIESV